MWVAPRVRLLLCNNPSAMTYKGTNTYIVGTTDLVVIDPGPNNHEHLAAILSQVAPDQRITHIVVTHSHLDHSPLAQGLSEVTGAPVFAFGDAFTGRSPIMTKIAAQGLAGGGEGIDHAFSPDHTLADGACLLGTDWQLEVIHTPGHLGNHICLALGDICFSGDHVMGWASSLVSPPDGDLTDFMASCRTLAATNWSLLLPGHGAPVTAPAERLHWLIAHRTSREAAILAELAQGPASVTTLTRQIYQETPDALLPAAERNVFAHLVDLHQKNQVHCPAPLGFSSQFSLS